MKKEKKRLFYILLAPLLLLTIPLIATNFTEEVSWTLMDYIVAGILLYTVGICSEMVMRKIKSKRTRIILLLLLLVLLTLVWLELSVGIFGSPFAGS